MNKKKFTIFYSIWWMLTYVISYLKIGFAFGIAGVMINQRGSINSDSLDTVSIIFSLATGACYVGMYVITNKWGTVVGKKWLVSMPVIGGIFDALIGIPIIPSILCIIGLILGLTSDPLDSSQKNEHPGQSESTKEINFAGVTELSNDAYKIYLVERYTITKNDVLAGFTLNGSIYNSLDEALIAAHALHCPKISIPSTQDIKEEIEPASKQITSGFQVQNSDSKSSIQISAQNELEQTSQNEINYKQYQSTKSSNTKIIFASIALIVVAFLVFRYIQLSQDNVLNYSNSSPEDRCRAAKIQALKSSEPFFVALMKGERGMSVTGYQEAISATKAAGLVCGIDNYTYSNLLNESEFTGSGFALKQDKEIKNSASEITKSDAAVINYQSSQTSEPCKKVGEARFNSAVAEKCSGTWNVYASIPNGGVWYSDKMGNDPEAKQINSQAKKVEERLQGCGLVVHISLSNWFDSFTSNLVVVHSSPHPSAVEAAEELKRMKQCGIDGYSKKSDYRVAGRD